MNRLLFFSLLLALVILPSTSVAVVLIGPAGTFVLGLIPIAFIIRQQRMIRHLRGRMGLRRSRRWSAIHKGDTFAYGESEVSGIATSRDAGSMLSQCKRPVAQQWHTKKVCSTNSTIDSPVSPPPQ